MAKKTEEVASVEVAVEAPSGVATVEEPVAQVLSKVGRYNRFEDIPEYDRAVLFSTIVDYSQQALSGSIQRDTAIFLIYDKFKELIG